MARKDQILDALVEIFRTQGIGADFTISQLAAKVDIGKSTIYEYFDTKDQLLQEAVIRVVDKSIETIHNHELVDSDFETQIKKELSNLFDIALNSRFLFNLITPNFKRIMPDEHRKKMTEKIKSVNVFYQERFTSVFSKGIVEGKLKPELVGENQMLLTSLVVGSIIRIANANMEIDKELNIKDYIDKVYTAIIKITN
ncbi:Nucleoid occlusion factor SlmA [Candidatus Izimaplasma bacterium HR1]|uniref:TetR/AcrR family transcriptional regulator n=1 Tax=Candidatus Izimoplasma sp. HR1 TaxID=1541959 RepID=UPI0004F69BF6|nr:Nucleoid occlusion factor SlmA [Candidatus Izimaplasma bacterium HR1]